jgi:hypothetical protein
MPQSRTQLNGSTVYFSRQIKEISMTAYELKMTTLLCEDLRNDFLSKVGKLFPWVKEIAKEHNMLENLRTVVRTSREARFGTTLEDLAAHRQAYLDELTLQPPVAGARRTTPFIMYSACSCGATA